MCGRGIRTTRGGAGAGCRVAAGRSWTRIKRRRRARGGRQVRAGRRCAILGRGSSAAAGGRRQVRIVQRRLRGHIDKQEEGDGNYAKMLKRNTKKSVAKMRKLVFCAKPTNEPWLTTANDELILAWVCELARLQKKKQSAKESKWPSRKSK